VESEPHPASSPLLTRLGIAAFAAIYAVILLISAYVTPLSRTQEARVLETARQMRDEPLSGWLTPMLNGEPRLRKPPLPYWYTAASYNVFGVSQVAGRLPSIVILLGTLAVTYCFARDVIDPRAGAIAACTLAGSYFFTRFGRLAETDAPAMFGVLVGFWSIVRAEGARAVGRRVAWHYLAALGIVIAAMSKGPPAAFVLAFLIYLCVNARSIRPLWRFILSGAPFVAAAGALAWYAFIALDEKGGVLLEEIHVVSTGSNHRGLFVQYIPELATGLLPMTGVYVMACIAMVKSWRTESVVRLLAGTGLAVFLPLCFVLNNQPHYLLPMLPGCALLCAWWICRAGSMRSLSSQRSIVDVVLFLTSLFAAVASIAVAVIDVRVNSGRPSVAGIVAIFGLAGQLFLYQAVRRRATLGQSRLVFVAMIALASTFTSTVWIPTTDSNRMSRVADAYRQSFGDALLCSDGEPANLVLCYEMRREAVNADTPDERRAFLTRHPNGVVMREIDLSVAANPADSIPPDGMAKELTVTLGDKRFDFYRVVRSTTQPTTIPAAR
jgi:4-amino-4-deoxy-L-arabinose transferase-like glycosyltransferase